MRIPRALPLVTVLHACGWAQVPAPMPTPMPLPVGQPSSPTPDPNPNANTAPRHFGFLASLALPLDDLRDLVDGKPAYLLGAYLVLDMGQGRALRPRVDWFSTQSTTTYQGPAAMASGGDSPIALTDNKWVKGLSLGCDYLYHIGSNLDGGFYLMGGLGLTSVQFGSSSTEAATGAQASENYGQRSTAFYWSLGAGYQLTPLIGVESFYRQTRMGANLLMANETDTVGGATTGRTAVQFLNAQIIGLWGVVLTVRF